MEENKKLEEGYNELNIDLNERKNDVNKQIKNPSPDAEEIDFVKVSSKEMEELIDKHFKKLKDSINK